MKVAILDGYIDEPACLGVPPYISPQVRYLAGAITDSKLNFIYLTIDEYRRRSARRKLISKCDLLIIIAGAVVPGKYIGGSPISYRESTQIANEFDGITILGGPAGQYGFFDTRTGIPNKLDTEQIHHLCSGDLDACFFDYFETGEFSDRRRTIEEQNKWVILGPHIVLEHPNYPDMLIAEIESYRGCVRYNTGGCSFCIEPGYGKPIFREPVDIIEEVNQLKKAGVKNFRLGAQSCIYSYKSKGVGDSEIPEPDPEEVEKLFSGLRDVIGPSGILHVDNANPAVLAEYPEQSRKITKTLVSHCSSGNVVAFGLESVDPQVAYANNLNSTPSQVIKAIEMVNYYGRERGPSGLPKLLPGLNFIAGLEGERLETYSLNLDFLREILKKNLLLRRINIRQVAMIRKQFSQTKFPKEFRDFKKQVREEIDRPMLEKVVPAGALMKDVYTEKHEGDITFGRQIGTYPILIGIPYKLPLRTKLDLYIFEHGYRSITGVQFPFPINTAPMSHIKALPGVGARRAARIVRARPFETTADLKNGLDDQSIARELLKFVILKK